MNQPPKRNPTNPAAFDPDTDVIFFGYVQNIADYDTDSEGTDPSVASEESESSDDSSHEHEDFHVFVERLRLLAIAYPGCRVLKVRQKKARPERLPRTILFRHAVAAAHWVPTFLQTRASGFTPRAPTIHQRRLPANQVFRPYFWEEETALFRRLKAEYRLYVFTFRVERARGIIAKHNKSITVRY